MSWIAVGLCDDVPVGTVVPRCANGVDLAIWRSNSGTYHAWGDRCPHRGMRLSHGFVRGETLACIYHGWQYDEAGSCVGIPAHPDLTPPKTICAQTYACSAKDGLIWVALNQTEQEPPRVAGIAVRSIDVARAAEEVAFDLNAPNKAVIELGGPHSLVLAIQPCSDASTMLHCLADPDQDRRTVSRALEDLRIRLEAAA